MIWLYIILALIVLVGLFLLLRLRVRVVLDDDQKIVFAGLGRSGPEIDFVAKTARIKVAGLTLKRYSFSDLKEKATADKPAAKAGEPAPDESATERKAAPKQGEKAAKRAEKKRRKKSKNLLESLVHEVRKIGRFSGHELRILLKTIPRATLGFLFGLFRDCRFEELHGRIEAGFESPDTTGRAYGYYCAVTGALPGSVGRFDFIPVWTGASFDGSMRLSVGLPLYRLLYRAIRLLWHLPIRKLWKLKKSQ